MDYFRSSIFYQLDVSWIVLIAAGIFMFISSIITIVVLCLLWRRHRTSIPMNTNTQIPIPIENVHYETQVCIKLLFLFGGMILFSK
jgi:hypothetical protein